MITLLLALVLFAPGVSEQPVAKECWVLTELKGQSAFSTEGYVFAPDGFSKPMVLCFEGNAGSVSGDDTPLTRFGASTLAGWVQNKTAELFEVYQIDRATGRVLFTKIRIGSAGLLPGLPDIAAAYVGQAVRIPD